MCYIYSLILFCRSREEFCVLLSSSLSFSFFEEMRWLRGKYFAVAATSPFTPPPRTTSRPRQKTQCHYRKRSSVLIYLRLCRESVRAKSIVVAGAASTQCMRRAFRVYNIIYILDSGGGGGGGEVGIGGDFGGGGGGGGGCRR